MPQQDVLNAKKPPKTMKNAAPVQGAKKAPAKPKPKPKPSAAEKQKFKEAISFVSAYIRKYQVTVPVK